MAYSTVPKTKRDGIITLIDGTTPTPVTLEVAYEEGNFSFDVPNESSELVIMDRGQITTVRKQDQQIQTGSFSFYFRQFTDGSEAGSVIDFINFGGFYSSNVSTGGAGSPYIEHNAINIKYFAEGSNFGDDADHEVVLSKCVITSFGFSEGDPSQFTINFNCYGGITTTGPA